MLTAEQLKKVLDYDPSTGVFTWKISPSRNIKPGSTAGADCDGYRIIRVGGRGRYKAHRLAWLYMTGEWPDGQVDHRDCNRSNNRWGNLRIATGSQNKSNMGPRSDNTSGFKGVSWYKRTNRWRVGICCQGKRKTIGYFKRKEDAAAAYKEAAERLFGEFARTA